jgi:hypothetical protein
MIVFVLLPIDDMCCQPSSSHDVGIVGLELSFRVLWRDSVARVTYLPILAPQSIKVGVAINNPPAISSLLSSKNSTSTSYHQIKFNTFNPNTHYNGQNQGRHEPGQEPHWRYALVTPPPPPAKQANITTGSSSTAAPGAGAGGAQNQDYGDKGLAAAEKKFGMSQSAATNEKITDAGRNFYEKQSGYVLPLLFKPSLPLVL